MIKRVLVSNQLGDTVVFDLMHPEKSEYLLEEVGGTSPTKADININRFATSDGGMFSSARANNRNITLSVIYWPNNGTSIEKLRHNLYTIIPTKQKVTVMFETDLRTVFATGYVESHEATIFSSSTGASISIICESAYFYSVDSQIVHFYGAEAQFEFPFSNESLTEKLIEFGEVIRDTYKNITYNGDEPTGIEITLKAKSNISNPRLYNFYTKESITVDTDILTQLTGSGFTLGDEINISTVKGNKYAVLLRNGNTINILNCLGLHPQWLELSQGNNTFGISFEGVQSDLDVTITYNECYKGV